MSEYKNRLTKFLIEKEGFDRVARQGEGEFYRDEDGNKQPIYTIGHGTTRYPDGSRVKEGDTLPPGAEGKNRARGYLRNFINNDVEQVTNQIDNFNKLPVRLKVALGGEAYRGSLAQSPRTIELINQGKYKEASKEFLNNDEFKDAVKLNRRGIIPRFKAVSDNLKLFDAIKKFPKDLDKPALAKREEPKEIEVEVAEEEQPKSFKQAFAEARGNKDAEFTYSGSKYNTKLKGETPQQYAAFLQKDRPIQVAKKGGAIESNPYKRQPRFI